MLHPSRRVLIRRSARKADARKSACTILYDPVRIGEGVAARLALEDNFELHALTWFRKDGPKRKARRCPDRR